MNTYFDKFSIINYNKNRAIDITQRAVILNSVFGNRYSFYPYVVKNGMRADQVAHKYYGDSDYTWLVYFSNNIVDPYYEWTMDDETFNQFIVDKYGSIQAAKQNNLFYRVNWYEDDRVISKSQFNDLEHFEKKYWSPNFDVNNNVVSYNRKKIDHTISSRDSNDELQLGIEGAEATYWSVVSSYDQEEEINAKKAVIRLLDNRLAPTAVSNLKSLLKV